MNLERGTQFNSYQFFWLILNFNIEDYKKIQEKPFFGPHLEETMGSLCNLGGEFWGVVFGSFGGGLVVCKEDTFTRALTLRGSLKSGLLRAHISRTTLSLEDTLTLNEFQ